MKERQFIETNRLACVIGVITICAGFVLGVLEMMARSAFSGIMIFRIVADVILQIVYIVAFRLQKEKRVFMYTGTLILIAAYVLQVFITNNIFMYAFMYPVAVYCMLYMDTRFTFMCGSACAVFNIIIYIVNMIRFPESKNQSFGQLLFALTSCFIVCAVVRIQNRHNKENMDEIEANIESSNRVNEEIMGLSNNLADRFTEAQAKADAMTTSMTTSNGSVEEIAKSIHTTAEAIEQQTVLTAGIQNNIQEANNETDAMKEASDASVEAVTQGIALMQKLGEQAELTAELNRESSETTDKLNQRILAVEDIISEILSISSQTNLLALNASIEAARAGEAGKGFAVVADEIRSLSEETKNSANKITDIINQLIGDAREASDNMKKSIEASGLQNQMIEETVEQIKTIRDKNDDLHTAMVRLSDKMNGVLTSNQKISDSISNLSAMSEQVAASSTSSVEVMGESMDAMSALRILLDQINEIAQKMKNVSA